MLSVPACLPHRVPFVPALSLQDTWLVKGGKSRKSQPPLLCFERHLINIKELKLLMSIMSTAHTS